MRKEKVMKKYKNHVRAANMLLQTLYELKQERQRQIQQKFKDFSLKCSLVTKDEKKFQRALEKSWYPTAEKIRFRVSRDLSDFSNHLEKFKGILCTDPIKLPNPGDLMAELFQVEQEFGDLKIDLKAKTLSVITEPIELEGFYFGPFEVQLTISEIHKLGAESPYRIIALEPNPAGSDETVTHPHVSNEKLCEGDGYVPIRKAIQQGRLSDFFMIIMQILQTYNPDSPYVSLSEWEGVGCYDCGYTVSGDDSYYCENCNNDYCSQCSTYCQKCEVTLCLGCSYECPGCGEPVCQNCTSACEDCGNTYCDDCLEGGICNECLKERKDQENEEESTEPKASAAFQSDCMGETIVHA